MTLYHDGYLFNPTDFVATIAEHVAARSDPQAYASLRAAALRMYDGEPRARELASRYGGWDRATLVAEGAADWPADEWDVAFWLTLLLYGQLRQPAAGAIGLRYHWLLLAQIAEALGWSAQERERLIKGQPLRVLVQQAIARAERATADTDWAQKLSLGPYSTGGEAGWLAHADADTLYARLVHDQHAVATVQLRSGSSADRARIEVAYDLAIEMVAAARAARCGLCLIISG